MQAAVAAFVETKFGDAGAYRRGVVQSSWRESRSLASQGPGPSPAAIQATTAYCDYVHRRYGRFPAYAAPFRTVIGFQVCRLDRDFYERFYRPEAMSESVRANTESILKGHSHLS